MARNNFEPTACSGLLPLTTGQNWWIHKSLAPTGWVVDPMIHQGLRLLVYPFRFIHLKVLKHSVHLWFYVLPRDADSVFVPPEFCLMIRGKLQIVKRPGNPLSKRKFRVKCKLQYPWVWRQLVCLQCRQSIPITNWYSISNNHFKGLMCINMHHVFTWCSPMPNVNIKFGNQAESIHHLVPRWWRICTTLAQDTPATADFCGILFVAIQAHKI